MNTVTVIGNVVGDPELRYTPDGTATTSFTVAVSRRVKDSAGAWKDQLDGFFKVVAWRGLAEHVAESVAKGTRVVVTGHLQQRRWETEDGSKRTSIEISAEDVGASVRFADVQVTKPGRRSYGGGEEAAIEEASTDAAMAYANELDD